MVKFNCIDGSIVNITLKSNDYPVCNKDVCKSNAQYRFGQRLVKLFPNDVVLEEFIIPKGGGLSLDFFMPRQRWAFEIQGRQHNVFVRYMHGTKDGFKQQQVRDKVKCNWCNINQITLIAIDDKNVDSVDILGVIDSE